MMQHKKKDKSTKDPDYPQGTSRRHELWHGYQKYIVPVTDAQVEEVGRIGDEYNGGDGLAIWEIDPIASVDARDQRSYLVRTLRENGAPLHELYVAHRAFTRAFLETTCSIAATAAGIDAYDEVQVEIQRLRDAAAPE